MSNNESTEYKTRTKQIRFSGFEQEDVEEIVGILDGKLKLDDVDVVNEVDTR